MQEAMPGCEVEGPLRSLAALLRASPHNLLSPRGLRELEERHFPESLAVAALLPADVRLLDVGSGGGLPGLVIALARPDIEVHLLEATRKKVDFLIDAVTQLRLSVTVHHGRAEELDRAPLRGSFDVVTARAVAPMDRLVPWCMPYLRPGGRLIAIKGARWAEEIAAASQVIASSGMRIVSVPESVVDEVGDDGVTPRVVVLERARK